MDMIAIVFLASGVFSFYFTKGKHVSYLIFWTVSALIYWQLAT